LGLSELFFGKSSQKNSRALPRGGPTPVGEKNSSALPAAEPKKKVYFFRNGNNSLSSFFKELRENFRKSRNFWDLAIYFRKIIPKNSRALPRGGPTPLGEKNSSALRAAKPKKKRYNFFNRKNPLSFF
jgi:hypothetical protein